MHCLKKDKTMSKKQSRLESLQHKHATMDAFISGLDAYPGVDSSLIRSYKVKKLHLKTEIDKIEKELFNEEIIRNR